MVVALEMINIPESETIYISKYISDAAENVKKALKYKNDTDMIVKAKDLARIMIGKK